MGKFITGVLVGCVIGYWTGVHHPDAFFRKYLPFDEQKQEEYSIKENFPCLEHFLKDGSKIKSGLEKELAVKYLYDLNLGYENEIADYRTAGFRERYTGTDAE